MKEKTAHRFNFAAILLSPPLRITFYFSLLSGLAAAGVKAAGNAAQRRSFMLSFSPFSLFICYAEWAVIGKFDKSDKHEKSSRCTRVCRASLMTFYVSLESLFLPWVLTQDAGKGGINSYLAMPSAVFTNLVIARAYQKTRKWLRLKTGTASEPTSTHIPNSLEENHGAATPDSTSEGRASISETSNGPETRILVLNLPSQETASSSTLTPSL